MNFRLIDFLIQQKQFYLLLAKILSRILVEVSRIELLTSCMPCKRSPS